jgi:hypothetical protein
VIAVSSRILRTTSPGDSQTPTVIGLFGGEYTTELLRLFIATVSFFVRIRSVDKTAVSYKLTHANERAVLLALAGGPDASGILLLVPRFAIKYNRRTMDVRVHK